MCSAAPSIRPVFHNLSFQILLSERQRPAGTDEPGEPRPTRGVAGRRGVVGWDGGAAGRPGARGDLSSLVPPSLGPVPICSFPRNSLSLAGAPRAADAPRSPRQGGFRRVNPWAGLPARGDKGADGSFKVASSHTKNTRAEGAGEGV